MNLKTANRGTGEWASDRNLAVFADSPFRRFVIRVRLYLLTENGFLPRNRA